MAQAVLDPALRDPIEAMYRATDGPPPGPPAGCPCCVDPRESAALVAAPRRTLGDDVLGRYAMKAMSTWGDERDFRWFAPRIAELIATDGCCGAVDVERFASKLVQAAWTTWAAAPVEAYYRALWRRALEDDARDALEVLDGMTQLGIDPDALVAAAALDAPVAAVARLVIEAAHLERARGDRLLRALAAAEPRLIDAFFATGDVRAGAAADHLAARRWTAS